MKEKAIEILTSLDYSELTVFEQESITLQLLTWILVVLISIFK